MHLDGRYHRYLYLQVFPVPHSFEVSYLVEVGLLNYVTFARNSNFRGITIPGHKMCDVYSLKFAMTNFYLLTHLLKATKRRILCNRIDVIP